MHEVFPLRDLLVGHLDDWNVDIQQTFARSLSTDLQSYVEGLAYLLSHRFQVGLPWICGDFQHLFTPECDGMLDFFVDAQVLLDVITGILRLM